MDVETEEEELEGDCVEPEKKRRRTLEVPAREARRTEREKRKKELAQGLHEIEKFIKSRKTQFKAGDQGLQATRARGIQSYLHLVVKKGTQKIEASQMAALTSSFSASFGGRMIRLWAQDWLLNHHLPESKKGCHVKLKSLLDDLSICAEIQAYLRSNKWATNSAKLAD